LASTSEPESRRSRGSGHALLLCLLLGAETLAYALFRLPTDLGFDANAFGDRGDFLSIAYLVAHGSRPAIDFGYHWGLVPILLAQAWFALFGATVHANEAIMVICALMVAIGMARMAAALRLGNLGVGLLVVALPFAFPTFTLTYALEAALLSNALAAMALLGNLSHFAQIGDQWRTASPSLVTAGMWASPEEVQEWEQVQRAVSDNRAGKRALVLSAMGCAPLLSARLEPPFANHFTPGELMPDQLARLMRQIDLAQRIVVVISPGFGNMLVWWPDIQHALDRHTLIWRGKSFAVYGPRRLG